MSYTRVTGQRCPSDAVRGRAPRFHTEAVMRRIEREARAIRLELKKFGKRNTERVVFTIPEAAARIGISQASVERLINAGVLRAVRPRQALLITAHQVERYCAQRH